MTTKTKTPSTKMATSKGKAKPRKPSQLDRIEDRLRQMEDRLHHSITTREPLFENIQRDISRMDRRSIEQGKVLDSICRSLAIDLGDRMKANTETLNRINSDLSLIRSGMETRTQGSPVKVEVIASKPAGLQPGDYCQSDEHHSLKEVAERLTAMGLPTYSNETLRFPSWEILLWRNGYLLGAHSSRGVTLLPTPEFLSRAEVTAREQGLVPVVPVPWVPKVGDWAICVKTANGSWYQVGKLYQYTDKGMRESWTVVNSYHPDAHKGFFRPATPAEVQAHQAAIAAKEEAARVPKFGVRVEVKGKEGEVWKVACDEPSIGGDWRLVPPKCGFLNTMTAKRHEFKIIP